MATKRSSKTNQDPDHLLDGLAALASLGLPLASAQSTAFAVPDWISVGGGFQVR